MLMWWQPSSSASHLAAGCSSESPEYVDSSCRLQILTCWPWQPGPWVSQVLLKVKGWSVTPLVWWEASGARSLTEKTELYRDLSMMGERTCFPSCEGHCQSHHNPLEEHEPILPSVTQAGCIVCIVNATPPCIGCLDLLP